jgi:hypothetical protein
MNHWNSNLLKKQNLYYFITKNFKYSLVIDEDFADCIDEDEDDNRIVFVLFVLDDTSSLLLFVGIGDVDLVDLSFLSLMDWKLVTSNI